MTEYSRYQFFLSIFNSLFMVATFIFAWWRTRTATNDQRFTDVDKRIGALETKAGNLPAHCGGHASLSGRQENQAERLAQYKELLTAVEGDLKHLPTVRDIEKLYARMDEFRVQVSNLQSEVSKIAGAMPGISHMTEMMNEFLLNHGGKN